MSRLSFAFASALALSPMMATAQETAPQERLSERVTEIDLAEAATIEIDSCHGVVMSNTGSTSFNINASTLADCANLTEFFNIGRSTRSVGMKHNEIAGFSKCGVFAVNRDFECLVFKP